MMIQMMEEVDHKYRTYLHGQGQPVPKPVDLSGCVNACAVPAPETPEQLIETEEGEVSEGPAPPAAAPPPSPMGPASSHITAPDYPTREESVVAFRNLHGREPTPKELETFMNIESVALMPGELPPVYTQPTREYVEERIHKGPEGTHREIVRGVETEPVAVPPVQDMQLRRIDETVLQWVFLTTGIDGIVVDKERAENPNIPCKVTEYTKEDGKTITLGFKPGVIGMLSPEQLERFCPPGAREGFSGSEDLKRRFAVFSKASEKCKLATEGGPKGIVHLEDRLRCMTEEARKHMTLNGGLPQGV
jgi:hypothetical protein